MGVCTSCASTLQGKMGPFPCVTCIDMHLYIRTCHSDYTLKFLVVEARFFHDVINNQK